MFQGRVCPKQIKNFWTGQAWEKYKACEENLVKHTGGGNGDDDWYDGSETDDTDDDTAEGKPRLKRTVQGNFSMG